MNITSKIKDKVIKKSVKNTIFKDYANVIAYYNKVHNNNLCFTDIPTKEEVEETVSFEFDQIIIDLQSGESLTNRNKYNFTEQEDFNHFLMEELVRRFSKGITLAYGEDDKKKKYTFSVTIIDGSMCENISYNIRTNKELLKFFTASNMVLGIVDLEVKTSLYDYLTDKIEFVINTFQFDDETTTELGDTKQVIDSIPVSKHNLTAILGFIINNTRSNITKIVNDCLDDIIVG